MMRAVVLTLALFTALAASAEKKKTQQEVDMEALLGGDLGATSVDDLKKATSDIKAKDKSDRLKVKGDKEGNGKLEFMRVFAAQKIKLSKKEGCIPADRRRTRLSYFTFFEFPEKSDPFAVCLSIKSGIGREVRMTTRIVDARNRRVAWSADVIDFRGKSAVDHVMDFPSVSFPHAGKYFYVIEIDGEVKAKMPLFDVNKGEE